MQPKSPFYGEIVLDTGSYFVMRMA